MTSRLPLVPLAGRLGVLPAVILGVVLAVTSLVFAAPALAHSSQIASTPAAGAVLATPPSEVVVEFDTPLLDIGAAIVVRTSDGVLVSTGAPRIERRTIAVSLAPDAPDGTYTVAYRVVSQDGHTVESTFDFQVGTAVTSSPAASSPAATSSVATSPATSSPAPTASADPADGDSTAGHSALVWIVAGVLLLVVIGVGAVLLRR